MRFLLVIVFLTVLGMPRAVSQDTINLNTGKILVGRVLEVGQQELRYKRLDNLSGPVYVLALSEVSTIRYENGAEDDFELEQMQARESERNLITVNNFVKGQRDASMFYDGYKGAATLSFGLSLLSPMVGLVPTIICASVRPSEASLNCPDPVKMENPDYSRGYHKRAKKMKSNRVWRNFAIGSGLYIGILFALSF